MYKGWHATKFDKKKRLSAKSEKEKEIVVTSQPFDRNIMTGTTLIAKTS